jgi:CheY-like chemotaxis protein
MSFLNESAMNGRLDQFRILIVEDEVFIALDLLHAVEDAGGEAVGPATTLAQALVLIAADGLHGAILDANLPDGHIGPVLEALRPEVAVVVHTGVDLPRELKQRFAHIPVFIKPTPPAVLTGHLATLLQH